MFTIVCVMCMLFTVQKHLSDKYLFLMVAAITAPILLILTVQVAACPLTLQTDMTINEV